MLLIALEIFALLATATLAFLWVRDPGGNYEPWTVICGGVFTGIELYRRFQQRSDGESSRRSRTQELVHWIQEHGTEKPLSQVLPRALQLAQLLGDEEFEHWIRMELYGYTQVGGMREHDTVPEYREVTGRYMDQYDRMLHIDDPKLDFVNAYRFRFGVRQLEELAKKTDMQNVRDETFIEMVRQHLHVDVFRFCFSPVEVAGVLDRIRNRLLEKVNVIERKSEASNAAQPAI